MAKLGAMEFFCSSYRRLGLLGCAGLVFRGGLALLLDPADVGSPGRLERAAPLLPGEADLLVLA